MADEITAYCVKEKTQKPMNDPHEVTLKNGKHAMQGICSSCGTKMMKFISVKKAAPSGSTEPAGQTTASAESTGHPTEQSTPPTPTP